MGQQLPPGDDDEYVDVYWYRYWDADLERMTVSRWMATREAIGERGEPIRETARRVHRSELDGFGRLIVTERKMH